MLHQLGHYGLLSLLTDLLTIGLTIAGTAMGLVHIAKTIGRWRRDLCHLPMPWLTSATLMAATINGWLGLALDETPTRLVLMLLAVAASVVAARLPRLRERCWTVLIWGTLMLTLIRYGHEKGTMPVAVWLLLTALVVGLWVRAESRTLQSILGRFRRPAGE